MSTGSAPGVDVTGLLHAWGRGDAQAGDELAAAVHGELRRVAARRLRREGPGHTLSPTALVNEAYLRLVDQRRVAWQSRSHFFAVASRLMRRVLIDHARRRRAARRGGSWCRVSLDDALAADRGRTVDVLALEEALEGLADRDAEKARVVELRFYGGLTLEETAEAMGLSTASVSRHWRFARAWLYRRLRDRTARRRPDGGS